jgi:pimeloyl-ACP methyl ester carboxylesterase
MPTLEIDGLSICFRDEGPRTGVVILLLHGWPDDASTWNAVAPTLNEAGFRTITPMLRGFGKTRFLSDRPRTGDSGVLALDAIALLDHLKIRSFAVAGQDWGVGIAEALAVGWPERVTRVALLSSPMQLGGRPTPSFEQAQRYWYHWFQVTKRGEIAIRNDPIGFARLMWRNWSPPNWFSDRQFNEVARSFANPDWVSVTLHSYRSRWEEVDPDPSSKDLLKAVREQKQLSHPAIFIQGLADGVTLPSLTASIRDKFSDQFRRIELPDVGHFPTREAPSVVAAELQRHFGEA